MAAVTGDGDGGGASSPRSPASASKSKGKAKVDAGDEAEAWTCGVCLARPREAIRGELDCCAHRFCFVCIMAWARVESRCPFCKARFRTIRRPPVPGMFPSERVVAVPERNQVYHPEGNASSTVSADAYANTVCGVCNCCRHDELLMLCDLCDSAAHTYCVGLGTIVPEGDWFCENCAASKEEHSRCQVDDEGLGGQGEFEISIDALTAEAAASPSASGIVDEAHGTSSRNRTHVQSSRISTADPVPSIYDIVGDDYTTNAGSIRLQTNSENFLSQDAPSAGSQRPKPTRGQYNGLASYHALIRKEIERTRALRNSRNHDKRIRALRESWASLRDGSMGFRTHVPSGRTQSGFATTSAVTGHQQFAVPTVVCSKNGASSSSGQPSLASFSEETSNSLGHGNKTSQKDTRDVRKAWKMLQMAKTSGQKKISNNSSSLNHRRPPFSMGNRSSSYSPIDTILGLKNQNLNKVAQKINANCDHGAKMGSGPTTENSEQCRSLPESSHLSVHERMDPFQDRLNEGSNGEVAASNNCHNVGQTLEPLCGKDRSEKVKSDTRHPAKCSLSSGQSTVTSLLQLELGAGSQSTVMVNPEDSSAACVVTTDEIRSSATTGTRKTSGPDRHERKRKLDSEKCHDQTSKRSKSNCKIAKTEISSLAIRELKLLKIDKTYGSDRFKEVARTATHMVLAAYGFEHSSSRSLALSRPVCEHSAEDKLLKSPSIVDSCAECLRDFVKEAISSALSCRRKDKTVGTF